LLAYKIPTGKKTRYLFVIRNPYGEICKWGFKEDVVTQVFQEIKQKLSAVASGGQVP